MPVFIGTPIQTIGSPFCWINDLGGLTGRFNYGGAIFYAGREEVSGALIVIRSTDGGVTWTGYFQGDANVQTHQCVLDSTNGFLVFAGLYSTHVLYTCRFDLNALSFSSTVVSAIAALNPGYAGVMAQRPNGDVLFIYNQTTTHNLQYVQITANTFGTPGLVDTAAAGETLVAQAAVSDASGLISIFCTNSGVLLYNSLNSSNVPGGRQTAGTGGSWPGLKSTALATSYGVVVLGVFNDPVQFIVGTPASAPTTWTQYDLHSATPGIFDGEGFCALVGSEVWFFYSHSDFSTLLEIMRVRWDGTTIFPPEVFWDVVANRVAGAVGVPAANLSTDGITGTSDGSTLGIAVNTTVDSFGDLSAVYLSIPTGGQSGYINHFF